MYFHILYIGYSVNAYTFGGHHHPTWRRRLKCKWEECNKMGFREVGCVSILDGLKWLRIK
jgi:hypothetical protein